MNRRLGHLLGLISSKVHDIMHRLLKITSVCISSFSHSSAARQSYFTVRCRLIRHLASPVEYIDGARYDLSPLLSSVFLGLIRPPAVTFPSVSHENITSHIQHLVLIVFNTIVTLTPLMYNKVWKEAQWLWEVMSIMSNEHIYMLLQRTRIKSHILIEAIFQMWCFFSDTPIWFFFRKNFHPIRGNKDCFSVLGRLTLFFLAFLHLIVDALSHTCSPSHAQRRKMRGKSRQKSVSVSHYSD